MSPTAATVWLTDVLLTDGRSKAERRMLYQALAAEVILVSGLNIGWFLVCLLDFMAFFDSEEKK